MKLVFSVKKFEERMKENGFSQERIDHSKEIWANKCDGLTENEMFLKYGYLCSDGWMIEVE